MSGRSAALLVVLLASSGLEARALDDPIDEAVSTTSWAPRTEEPKRAHVLTLLRDVHLLELRGGVTRARAADGSDDHVVADEVGELTEEELAALAERRASERAWQLSLVAAERAALVDVIAMNGVATAHLRDLELAALAGLGPREERSVLLELVATLRGEAPFDLFGRLGQLAEEAQEVEAQLLALLPGADRGLSRRCYKTLTLGGGAATVAALVPSLMAGAPDGNDLYNVLDAIARREGDVVARALVGELQGAWRAQAGREGALDVRHHHVLAHQLLATAASAESTDYLVTWVEERLLESSSFGGVTVVTARALEAALRALATCPEERGLELLVRLEQDRPDWALRKMATEALGFVPEARTAERDAAFATLVDGLERSEREQELLPVRMIYVSTLRRMTGAPVSPSALAWREFVARQRAARVAAEAEAEATAE